MRLDKLFMLLALAGGFAFATACGGSDDKDTDPGTTGDDDDDDAPVDTYTPPEVDTALAYAAYIGGGTVGATDYTGWESFIVIANPTGDTLCDWIYDATGVPSTAATPCTDGAGNACEFAIDVTLSNGRDNGGCVDFLGTTYGTDGGPYPYGYHANYYYAGMSYGPLMMYYFADNTTWYAVGGAAFDSATTEFAYEWPIGYIAYQL